MKLSEALELIPKKERKAVVAEVQKATSVEDIEAIVKRYGLEADAQAIYDELSFADVEEGDLEKLAGGCGKSMCSCSCDHS